jgi:hypothetical protein
MSHARNGRGVLFKGCRLEKHKSPDGEGNTQRTPAMQSDTTHGQAIKMEQRNNIPACIKHIRHERCRRNSTRCVYNVGNDRWERRCNSVCNNCARR